MPDDRPTPGPLPEGVLATEEIAARFRLGERIDERWIEWAIEMLTVGYDTPSLRVLAGESQPFVRSDLAPLVDRVLEELGAERHTTGESAAMSLARVRIRQMLDRKVPQELAIFELADLCRHMVDSKDLYDFALLAWALEELHDDGVQSYWPEGNRETMPAVIDAYCREWLEKHGG